MKFWSESYSLLCVLLMIASQSDVLNPTIVVEMYQETVDLPVRVDDVTKAITIAIQTVILEPRSINHIG